METLCHSKTKWQLNWSWQNEMFTVKDSPSLSVEVVFMLLESERHHLSPDSSNSVDAVLTPACFSFGFYLDQRWEATFLNRLCLNHCWSVVYVRERLWLWHITVGQGQEYIVTAILFIFWNSSWSLTEWELWSATRPTQSAEQMFTMNVFCKPCLAGNCPVVLMMSRQIPGFECSVAHLLILKKKKSNVLSLTH